MQRFSYLLFLNYKINEQRRTNQVNNMLSPSNIYAYPRYADKQKLLEPNTIV